MSNLKEYITARYGASIYKQTITYKEIKKKIAKSKNQFIFLQRCVHHKIIPKSLRIKSPIHNNKAKDIVERYRFKLLISVKNDAKHRFFRNIKDSNNMERNLMEILTIEDMATINNVSEEARESMFIRSKERLIKKFNLLNTSNSVKNKNEGRKNTFVKEPVLNLCADVIPKHQQSLLNLGPKFVPNVNTIPYMDIVATTESSALKLEYQQNVCEAQVLRREVLRALKLTKPVQDNLTREQRLALKEIRKDSEIRIYPFDKGSGLVRIKNEDAMKKINEQIGNTKIVEEDPTSKFARDIRKTLSVMNKKGRFTKKEYESIYPSDAIPPRMYGTIKAHKPEKNYPMRIVVSTIGTPSYGISEYLVKFIQHTLNKNETRIRNSTSFVNNARTWNISPDEIQVSYDVVNLYPSVPLKEATKVILDLLNEDTDLKRYTKLSIVEIKTLIELCLSKCYFLWDNKIHMLEDSGPIGLSLMVVIAEGYLQVLEKKAFNDALHVQPPIILKSFYRYVDDSHARFPNITHAKKFKEILNRQCDRIQYTMDEEDKNKELEFLDIKIRNDGEGKYEFKVFRKKAITNVQVKPTSSHDPNILKGIFKGFLHRAYNICSEKYLDKEIEFLMNIFMENGYRKQDLTEIMEEVKSKRNQRISDIVSVSVNDITQIQDTTNGNEKEASEESTDRKQTITLPWIPRLSPKLKKIYRKAGFKVVFKSSSNIQSLLTSRNKSKLPRNSFPGVYKIRCSCNPNKNPYVGETKMKVSTRMIQHQESLIHEKWDKSALALHSSKCEGNILWEETETIKIEGKKFNRKVREALEIQYNECRPNDGGMNLDDGQYVTTKFWTPFFKFLKKKQK